MKYLIYLLALILVNNTYSQEKTDTSYSQDGKIKSIVNLKNNIREGETKLFFEDGTVKVAPLIFMAFVENAFKYASRDDNAINRIMISLKQQAGKIDFVCENTYDEGESSSGGIGLINATRRLELLYKDRYQLEIKNENNIYRVQLMLML